MLLSILKKSLRVSRFQIYSIHIQPHSNIIENYWLQFRALKFTLFIQPHSNVIENYWLEMHMIEKWLKIFKEQNAFIKQFYPISGYASLLQYSESWLRCQQMSIFKRLYGIFESICEIFVIMLIFYPIMQFFLKFW